MEPEAAAKGAEEASESAEEVLSAPKPKTAQAETGYYDKLTQSIQKAAGEKNSKVAAALKAKGIGRKKWESMSLEEKNKLIKQIDPKHRAYIEGSEKAAFRTNEIGQLLEP